MCGTENSGVWVLKGDARTYNLPGDLVSDSLEVIRDRSETDFKGTISSGASGACVDRVRPW